MAIFKSEIFLEREPATDARLAPLTVLFKTFEDVQALDDESLGAAQIEHEAQIAALTGKISAASSDTRKERLKRIRIVLKRNLTWIIRQIKVRNTARNMQAQRELIQAKNQIKHEKRIANEQEVKRNRAEKEALKLAAIKASNDESARQTAVFKEVAQEVLGSEMYLHLWELARQRFEERASS